METQEHTFEMMEQIDQHHQNDSRALKRIKRALVQCNHVAEFDCGVGNVIATQVLLLVSFTCLADYLVIII